MIVLAVPYVMPLLSFIANVLSVVGELDGVPKAINSPEALSIYKKEPHVGKIIFRCIFNGLGYPSV